MKLPQGRKPRSRAAGIAIAAGAIALVAGAEADLHRRPAEQIRGDKRVWRVVCLNAIGAGAYLLWGRRR